MNEREQAQQHAARLETIADQISGANARRELRYAATFLRALADRPEPAQPVAQLVGEFPAPIAMVRSLQIANQDCPKLYTVLTMQLPPHDALIIGQRLYTAEQVCDLLDRYDLGAAARFRASHPAPSEAAPERQKRCPHGVLWPHECKDCIYGEPAKGEGK